jgi:DNA-binding LacI/PurR family transcriptional regulator/signal transduction histidine kinase
MDRLRIGLLIDDLEFTDTYQDILWRTARKMAEQENFDLVVFPGHGSLKQDDPGRGHSALYRLARSPLLDGLVVSPSTSAVLPEADRAWFFRYFAEIPLVTFSVRAPGVPIISVETEPGLRELLDHMLTHNHNKIAMLRGPDSHPDARLRYQVWAEVMRSHHRPVSEDFWVMGNLGGHSVHALIGRLLKTTGGFDALFCVNDRLAMDSIQDLQRRGLRVPQDVAVYGFDDIGQAQYCDPPLTTVRQPIQLQIEVAFRLLLDRIYGRPAADVSLPSHAVIRGSCGCPYPKVTPPDSEILGERQQLVDLQYKLNAITGLERYLSVDLTTEALCRLLDREAEDLGITRGVLSLAAEAWRLQDPEQTGLPLPPHVLTPLLFFGEEPGSAEPFPSEWLAPESWWRPATGPVVALPLVVEPFWFGLLTVNLDERNSSAVRGLQEQLASHFYRTYRHDELVRQGTEKELKTRVEEEKMEALTTLVVGMAHEINTPLGNSITLTTYLQEQVSSLASEIPGETEPVLSIRQKLNEGLSLLLKNLLKTDSLIQSLKKVAAQDQPGDSTAFDLAVHVAEIVRSLGSPSFHPTLNVRTDLPATLPVTASAPAFWEIFHNLMVNASLHAYPDHTPGPVEIALRQDGKYVELTFKDRGVGISPEELVHVFEPFYTTTRGRGGTGLGLHIVYNLVTNGLGGTIKVRSAPGKGTTFVIRFPAQPRRPQTSSRRIRE